MLYITIPTYNRAAALKKTLEIILPQLHENAQCVVLDNCSTDATPDVVAHAQRQSPYLRTIRHGVNVGGGANFLRCFEVAPTGWIWLLSDAPAAMLVCVNLSSLGSIWGTTRPPDRSFAHSQSLTARWLAALIPSIPDVTLPIVVGLWRCRHHTCRRGVFVRSDAGR
jgi:glycosyltransferase involved in cell wall biosynthesis